MLNKIYVKLDMFKIQLWQFPFFKRKICKYPEGEVLMHLTRTYIFFIDFENHKTLQCSHNTIDNVQI